MNEMEQLNQIKISRISIVIIIITLLHSLYLLSVEEKRIKNEPTISNKNAIFQSIINRVIVLIVTIIFLYLNFKNYDSLKENNASVDELNKQKARIVVYVLAFLSILIDVLIGLSNYESTK